LRGTRSALDLRALQKRVVEGLVAASMERTAATGRGFQDTGSTPKAFEGEEADWYACNAAIYHMKQSMDPSLPLVENEDLKRWLLVDDEMIMRAAALAAGILGLESLLTHYKAAEEWVDAARLTRAISAVSESRSERVVHAMSALALLKQANSQSTAAQQLELDISGNLQFVMHAGPEKKLVAERMQAMMAQNSSLRVDPLGLYFAQVNPRLYAMFGMLPHLWDAGQIATQDTIQEGFRLHIHEGVPLFQRSAEESVGARKEYIKIGYELGWGCVPFMSYRSTDQTVEMHHQLLEAKWGHDGSILAAACMDYRFDRHFMISQGIGTRMDGCLCFATAWGVAEHCGNVQLMVQLFDKQHGDMREFVKRGVPGAELPLACLINAPSFIGLGINALHPFGKEMIALFKSCEGQCTDPSDCEDWYESADFSVFVKMFGGGSSSNDGLHHNYLKPTSIATIQAVLSLSLASMGASSFDLSWLDALPAPDDPTLHECAASVYRFTNPRVVIAEVLEWQGRYKEASRCVVIHSSALLIHSFSLMHPLLQPSIAALQSPNCETVSISARPRGCEQGGW
jgi:hypothetical protein